jgi:hypothetical protein
MPALRHAGVADAGIPDIRPENNDGIKKIQREIGQSKVSECRRRI